MSLTTLTGYSVKTFRFSRLFRWQLFAYFFVQISAESHLQLSRASTVIVVPVDMWVVTDKNGAFGAALHVLW